MEKLVEVKVSRWGKFWTIIEPVIPQLDDLGQKLSRSLFPYYIGVTVITINLHYLQILYVQIHLLDNIYLYPQNQYLAPLQSFMDTSRAVKNVSCPTYTFPAEAGQDNTLPSYFSSHTINRYPFPIYWMPCFFTFLCFFIHQESLHVPRP